MPHEPVQILLAEDDPGHARLIQRNLSRVGLVNQVTHVSDGQYALDYIYRQGDYANRSIAAPLMVILDIKMPRIDGIEVLRRIKSDPAIETMPVIMLTTTDDPREIEKCYELGCNVYITKPVEYAAFVEAICRLGLFLQVVTMLKEKDHRKDPG
jgi:CheY-like chemotaxis protein